MSENIGHATPPILAKYEFTAGKDSRDSIGILTMSINELESVTSSATKMMNLAFFVSGVTIAHLSPGIQKEKAIKLKA